MSKGQSDPPGDTRAPLHIEPGNGTAPPAGFPVAVIGAGELRALEQFFAAVPPDNTLAFLVVAPALAQKNLVSQLQPHTSMPVCLADEHAQLAPNKVLVLPSASVVDSFEPFLQLRPAPEHHAAPVDACFCSAAYALGARASGVLLAGAGLDGALGLTHIRTRGGVAAIQADMGMYVSATDVLALAAADLLLPLAELPPRISQLARTLGAFAPDELTEPLAPLLQQTVKGLIDGIMAHASYDIADYRPQVILDRAERRRRLLARDTFDQYLQHMAEQPAEAGALLYDITSQARQFFGEPEVLDALTHQVIPHLFHDKQGGDQVRVWVIGCGTGEEAYSIGILLLEYMEQLADPPELRIFATDPNAGALRQAREGSYPQTIAAAVSPQRLQRYFARDGRWQQVSQAVRQRMVFAQHNPLRDPPFSKLDLVVCRNLLGQLQPAAQAQLAVSLHMGLKLDGHVCTGAGEPLDQAYFLPLSPGLPLYHRQSVNSPRAHMGRLQRPYADPQPARNPQRETERLFEQQARLRAPPGLLIDQSLNIVYYSGGATPYLHQHFGGAGDSVHTRIHPELLTFLSAPLLSALKFGETTQTQVVSFTHEGVDHYVRLTIQPVAVAEKPRLAAVFFVEQDVPLPVPGDGAQDAAVQELQQDVLALRRQLQLTAEEYTAVNEEMKIANKELMSLNEELQAKAAELGHSKSELELVNSQLRAINTENQHNLSELRRLWANLQNLIAASDIATLFLEVDLRIRWFTPGLGRLFNLQPGDQGRPIGHITHHLTYRNLETDALAVLHSATARELEVSSQTGAWHLLRILPFRTADNEIDGVVLTFIDITARKQAEDALRQLNVHLERRIEERTIELVRSNRELDQFAYVASHDLKAPLRAISNLADWITADAETVLPSSSRRHLDKLRGRVVRMEKLLDDLLTYSRAGRHLHKPEWVDITDLVRGIQLFLVLPLEFRIEVQTPGCRLYTERVPLETVLRNLIANAIKHHHQPQAGFVRIACRENGDWVTFTVADNGPGIAPQHQERIFQIFQTLKPRDQVEGSGMGLAVVKKTVESQGGQIEVKSNLGEGATFEFTWPKSMPDQSPP